MVSSSRWPLIRQLRHGVVVQVATYDMRESIDRCDRPINCSGAQITCMCHKSDVSPANKLDQEPKATNWLPGMRPQDKGTQIEKVQGRMTKLCVSLMMKRLTHAAPIFLSPDLVLRRSSSSQVFTKSRILRPVPHHQSSTQATSLPFSANAICVLSMPICHQRRISEVDLGLPSHACWRRDGLDPDWIQRITLYDVEESRSYGQTAKLMAGTLALPGRRK